MELLKTRGVHGAEGELVQLVEDVEGHALTLNLLGRFLARAHEGDVRQRDRVKLEKADRKTQGGHAFKTMAAYEKWLAAAGEDGARQLAVLRLLGLFDRPADGGCLAALRGEPVITGLTEPLVGLDEEDWNLTLSDLADGGLVTREGASLDAHPLIREYFALQLRATAHGAWSAAHGRLFVHLQARAEHQPASFEGLQPLYQAVAHGCQAGRQQEAYYGIYVNRILRGTGSADGSYSTSKLGAFGADLGAVACFFESPWSRVSPSLTEDNQAWLLNAAASRLRALGRPEEALEPLRVAMGTEVQHERWQRARVVAGNLSELDLTLGDIDGAVRDAEQSVDLANRSSDANSRYTSRTTLADALHQAGRLAEALACFREAEAMLAKCQPAYPLLYSLQGFQYCDLLLAGPERAAWQAGNAAAPAAGGGKSRQDGGAPGGVVEICRDVEQRAAQTLEWVTTQDWLLDIALDHLTLGRAGLYRAILERPEGSDAPRASAIGQASSEIEEAVTGLRRAGQLQYLPLGLLTRAWLRALTHDPDGARADLDEARELAERGPMPLFLADVHLHRARLFGDREALADARRLIEKHGYGRRLEELADAEEAAKSWVAA